MNELLPGKQMRCGKAAQSLGREQGEANAAAAAGRGRRRAGWASFASEFW